MRWMSLSPDLNQVGLGCLPGLSKPMAPFELPGPLYTTDVHQAIHPPGSGYLLSWPGQLRAAWSTPSLTSLPDGPPGLGYLLSWPGQL